MNPDYAHLLPDGRLDFNEFAKALRAGAGRSGSSLRLIARHAHVNEITVRRASRGQAVNAQTYLKLCIVLDLNPFACLVGARDVSQETGTVAACGRAPADV